MPNFMCKVCVCVCVCVCVVFVEAPHPDSPAHDAGKTFLFFWSQDMMASLSDQAIGPAWASSSVQHSACASATASLLSFFSLPPRTHNPDPGRVHDASRRTKRCQDREGGRGEEEMRPVLGTGGGGGGECRAQAPYCNVQAGLRATLMLVSLLSAMRAPPVLGGISNTEY